MKGRCKHPVKTEKVWSDEIATQMKGEMRQRGLFTDERSLLEKLCDRRNLGAGFKAVKTIGGAPGIDGVTVEEFGRRSITIALFTFSQAMWMTSGFSV